MVKRFFFIVSLLCAVLLSGCVNNKEEKQKEPNDVTQGDELAEKELEIFDGVIRIRGIGLGDTQEKVSELYGNDSIKTVYDAYGDTLALWQYEDLDVYFNEADRVTSIRAYDVTYPTNFDVKVEDKASDALEKCEKLFEPFVSMHSWDNQPNLGWYLNNNVEMFILYFDQIEDPFNTDVDINTATVKAIRLDHIFNFD